MNITPQVTQLPLATVVNPQTDSLRRENNQREVITQPSAINPSLAEQKVAGEKDRVKTPGQLNEQIDFAKLEKNASQAKEKINGQEENSNSDQNQQQTANQSTREESTTEESNQESAAEQKIIEQLKARDAEVRIHEQAHATVGGTYTGSPSYSYETGPDGKRYIVDGEVSVDLSRVPNDPRATIVKMRKVHDAALAPAEPSAQDRKVAQKASSIILQSQAELREQHTGVSEAKPSSIGTTKAMLGEQTDEQLASEENASKDFDQFINETLKSQESIAPTQSNIMAERATVIESLYAEVGNAYQKPPRSQFELTA